MSAQLTRIVMGMYFLLLTSFVFLGPLHAQSNAENVTRPSAPQPLAGSNSVSDVKISQTKAGVWMAEFDYFYTGDPPYAALSVELSPQPGSPVGLNGLEQYQTWLQRPQRGAHHVNVEIRYPGSQQRTLKAAVMMRSQMFSKDVVASQQIDKVID
jgi:hypothetical protein